ncbi:MAG: MarR family transcriptional regulator [Pseudomonadota bacterium]
MTRIDWPTASRFAGPQDSPGFRLWRRFHEWQRSVNGALAPHCLTQLQFSVLAVAAWLTREGGVVTQQAIADLGGLDRMLVSQVMRALETKGLVARKTNPADRRSLSITLTAAGARRLTLALPVVEAHDAAFLSEV